MIHSMLHAVAKTPNTLRFRGQPKVGPDSPPREKTVAVYGGASAKPGTPLYQMAFDLGRKLASAGFGVLTGGGPGTMEATTLGAESENGYTIGMAMNFIGEEPCLENDELHFFETFSDRLDVGYETRSALTIALPGGGGTLQEIFKKLVELYTDKTVYPSQKQILLVESEKEEWKPLVEYLEKGPLAQGLMNPKMLALLRRVKLDQVVSALKANVPWTPGLKNAEAVTDKPVLKAVA